MLRGAIVVRIETLSFSRRISASASILDEIISEIVSRFSGNLPAIAFLTDLEPTGPTLFTQFSTEFADLTLDSISETSSASGCGVPTSIPSALPEYAVMWTLPKSAHIRRASSRSLREPAIVRRDISTALSIRTPQLDIRESITS